MAQGEGESVFVPDLFQAVGESVGHGFQTTFWPNTNFYIDWRQNVGPDPFANNAWVHTGPWLTSERRSSSKRRTRRLFSGQPFGKNSYQKHPEFGAYLPASYTVSEKGWGANRAGGPLVQIVENGCAVAWFGIFSQQPLKAQRVFYPSTKWFRPKMPRPESLTQLAQLFEQISITLPRRLAPIPVARLDLCQGEIIWKKCWIDLPVPARVVVPKVPGQEAFCEWLSEYFSVKNRERALAHQSWTTRRIAYRGARLVQGLNTRHSTRFNLALELFQQFDCRINHLLYPGFLPPNDRGVNLLVEHLPNNAHERAYWQRMHGHYLRTVPNLDQQLTQIHGENLAGKPARGGFLRDQESVYYISSVPEKWLVLQQIIEKAPANL